MATLFDISLKKLIDLQSIDPYLDENFSEILTVIFYVLDTDSKRILLSKFLNPKGIFYNQTTKEFNIKAHDSLSTLLSSGFCEKLNGDILRITKRMQDFLDRLPPPPLQIKIISQSSK